MSMARNPNPIEAQVARITSAAKKGAGAEKALLALVGIADLDAEMNTREEPRGSNAGGMLTKYFKADDYVPGGKDSGYPWCAASVSYWLQTWLARCEEAKRLYGKITAPRTASAFGLIDWAKAQSGAMEVIPGGLLNSGVAVVRPGDVLVYTFSHCGIAKTHSKDRLFTAIEGNTDDAGSREGWEVARRMRGFSSVKVVLRFIPKGVPV